MTGGEFNMLYKDTKFYKFLNNNLTHHGFQYKLGLNIDVLPFNPSNKCSEGGLYFCEESKCYWYWSQYGHKLASVKIPDDAIIHIGDDKFKVNKLIIESIIYFRDVPNSFWINILPKNGYALEHVTDQTDELCKLAVNQNGYALQYVKNPTNELCVLAVQKYSGALQYVKDSMLTEEICKLAVQQNGVVISCIKNQTDELCKLAVQQNGLALNYVKKQTEEICMLAVQQNRLAIKYVKDQFKTEEICKLAGQY